MSNSPTLPPAAGSERKQTPLPAALATQGDARLQAALAASARAEASLSGLFRAIQHLGNGVGGAREANESLTAELEGLRDMLGTATDQQQRFEHKLEQLERVLYRTRQEYERERAFLIDQQDAFLVKLLDEQEAELKRRDVDLDILRGRLAELERRESGETRPPAVQLPSLQPPPVELIEPKQATGQGLTELERAEHAELERTAQKLAEDRERARATVARLQAQRDDAQSAVLRISKERDDALYQIHRLRSELGGPRIPVSTLPPPPDPLRDPVATRAPKSTPNSHAQGNLPPRSGSTDPAFASESSPSSAEASDGRDGTAIRSVLRPPRSNPNAAPLPTRLSPPPTRLSPPPAKSSPSPGQLGGTPTVPPSAQSSASSRPPLKQKPDPSTRPLVGYSMSQDSVEPEHLAELRVPSKASPPSNEPR